MPLRQLLFNDVSNRCMQVFTREYFEYARDRVASQITQYEKKLRLAYTRQLVWSKEATAAAKEHMNGQRVMEALSNRVYELNREVVWLDGVIADAIRKVHWANVYVVVQH